MRHRRIALSLMVTLFVVVAVTGLASAKEKVILDTDMVQLFDDGVAMMLLATSPNIELLGVTPVAGNTWAQEGVAYALRQLEVIGRTDIPVYQGCTLPLRPNRYENIAQEQTAFGKSSYIGAFRNPQPASYLDIRSMPYGGYPQTEPAAGHAVDFIIEQVKANPGEVTILAIGPCTNLAMAIRKAPEIIPLVKRVVYMGGAIDIKGNTTPAAEFNWWFDPEAAKICITAPWNDQLIVPLDVCEKYFFTKAEYDRIVASGNAVAKMFEAIYGPRFASNPKRSSYIWDAIAAVSVIDPSIDTVVETRWVDMDTNFGLNYGRSLGYTLAGPAGCGKARILFEIDAPKLWDIIVDLLSKAGK